MPAEHRDYFREEGKVFICNHNTIREFVTINAGTKWTTMMGDRCVMLRGSHLSHDSVLENNVNVSCNVLIGGESYIMEGANLGLGSIIHQQQIIGSYSMIGMGAVITKKMEIRPGYIWVGNPARLLKTNAVGLSRAQIDGDDLIEEGRRYESIRTTIQSRTKA